MSYYKHMDIMQINATLRAKKTLEILVDTFSGTDDSARRYTVNSFSSNYYEPGQQVKLRPDELYRNRVTFSYRSVKFKSRLNYGCRETVIYDLRESNFHKIILAKFPMRVNVPWKLDIIEEYIGELIADYFSFSGESDDFIINNYRFVRNRGIKNELSSTDGKLTIAITSKNQRKNRYTALSNFILLCRQSNLLVNSRNKTLRNPDQILNHLINDLGKLYSGNKQNASYFIGGADGAFWNILYRTGLINNVAKIVTNEFNGPATFINRNSAIIGKYLKTLNPEIKEHIREMAKPLGTNISGYIREGLKE